MFLIRPRPLPLESLSSWRQRAGVANRFRRYPRPDGVSSWGEPDRLPSLEETIWIQEEYRLSADEVQAMSLESVGKNISIEFGTTSKLRWVTPCVNRKTWNLGGSCCPLCLQEDQNPHYKLSWRFAFVTHCPHHGCLLLERCPNCSALFWPTNLRNISTERAFDFRTCNCCGTAIDANKDDKALLSPASRILWECATSKIVPADLAQAQQSHEVFSALWVVSQLLLRKCAAALWSCFPDDSLVFENCRLGFASGMNSVELLPINAKESVIKTAYWILTDWPSRFIYVCKKADLSRHVFSPTWQYQPEWMSNVIETNLCKRKLGITKAQVQAAIDSLDAAGKPISKSLVCRTLGVTESVAIDEVLFQRRVGSVSELKQLCGTFENRLITISNARDQKATLIRDYLIFLMSVIFSMKIEQVCLMNRASINRLLFEGDVLGADDSSLHKLLMNRARQLTGLYIERYRFTEVDAIGESCMFLARDGNALAGHTVRERITKMMKIGFPSNLWKSADVFLGVVTRK